MGILPEIEAALRLFGTLKEKVLSEEEKEILKAALDADGFIALFDGDMQNPPYVKVGNTAFHRPGDASYAAYYRRALANLIKRGYVEHKGGILYLLTGDGWDAAKKLRRD